MAPKKISIKQFVTALKPRPRDAHKGLFGHVLIIGGNMGYAGAAALAGIAALRVGAGLVSIVTVPENRNTVAVMQPECMVHGIKSVREVHALAEKATVIAVGPGLGKDAWAQGMLSEALVTQKPKIVDADALNLLAERPCAKQDWILTPHPGEAARLLKCETHDIQNAREAKAQALQKNYGGVIVLKGRNTLVCSANEISICEKGNPGMSSGGMGDVLTGVIAGLVAQGFSLEEAAKLGVCLHATAGDLAAKALGERGLVASDLFSYLHQLVNP